MEAKAAREGLLTVTPDKTGRVMASAWRHCGGHISTQTQSCWHRYDHFDLLTIRPIVSRMELLGERCRGCGYLYRAQAATGKEPGTPVCPSIRALLAYLHHSHHVRFERLSRIAGLHRNCSA